MPSYQVSFAPAAHRQFAKLPRAAQRRLAPHIDELQDEPRPVGAKKLSTAEEVWRIRAGTYRVVYAIEDTRLLVLVVKVGHRRDVYRGL